MFSPLVLYSRFKDLGKLINEYLKNVLKINIRIFVTNFLIDIFKTFPTIKVKC